MTDSAHAQFGFLLSDVTINVLTICSQILVMRNLDVTINVLTIWFQIPVMSNILFHYLTSQSILCRAYFTLRVLLFVKRWEDFSLFWLLPCLFIKVRISSVVNIRRTGVFHGFVCLNARSVVANSVMEVWRNRLHLASWRWSVTAKFNSCYHVLLQTPISL